MKTNIIITRQGSVNPVKVKFSKGMRKQLFERVWEAYTQAEEEANPNYYSDMWGYNLDSQAYWYAYAQEVERYSNDKLQEDFWRNYACGGELTEFGNWVYNTAAKLVNLYLDEIGKFKA